MVNLEKIEVFPHGDSGINVFKYKGQPALQVVGVEKAFDALEDTLTPFKRIVELGTDYGGLTNLLADHPVSDEATIDTFDINGERFVSHNDKITFHHTSFENAFDLISKLISDEGRVLLLCDGGNKRGEFQAFHKFLKVGDVIMGHDYSATQETFINECRGKIWNWHEFQDSYADFPGLEPYFQEVFKNYAWCCRIKV